MKKALSWRILLALALAIALIRAVSQGIIPDFLGLLEAIVFTLGVIDFFRWLFNRKKERVE